MKLVWTAALFSLLALSLQLGATPSLFGFTSAEVKSKLKNKSIAKLENLNNAEDKVMVAKKHYPGMWFNARDLGKLSEGDRVFVPNGAQADLYFKGESARLSLPAGAHFLVPARFELSKLQRQVFYFETEQMTVNSSKQQQETTPQFARAYWMRPGKLPAKSAKNSAELFATVVEAKEVEIVKPEGDTQIQSSKFPYMQTVLLGNAKNDEAELTAYLFDEDAGFEPVWVKELGRKRRFEIPIPKSGVYSFVALSSDQLSSTRHMKLFVQSLEETE
jgi:hypothetical protein